jgi:hypothetical protein
MPSSFTLFEQCVIGYASGSCWRPRSTLRCPARLAQREALRSYRLETLETMLGSSAGEFRLLERTFYTCRCCLLRMKAPVVSGRRGISRCLARFVRWASLGLTHDAARRCWSGRSQSFGYWNATFGCVVAGGWSLTKHSEEAVLPGSGAHHFSRPANLYDYLIVQ